jgi:hypothetical protein
MTLRIILGVCSAALLTFYSFEFFATEVTNEWLFGGGILQSTLAIAVALLMCGSFGSAFVVLWNSMFTYRPPVIVVVYGVSLVLAIIVEVAFGARSNLWNMIQGFVFGTGIFSGLVAWAAYALWPQGFALRKLG